MDIFILTTPLSPILAMWTWYNPIAEKKKEMKASYVEPGVPHYAAVLQNNRQKRVIIMMKMMMMMMIVVMIMKKE